MKEINEVDYLQHIVCGLVQWPDDVKISRTVDEMGVLISLEVHRDDMGRVIGREGRIAQAIRILLSALGYANHSKISLKVVEPKNSAAIPSVV